MTVFCHCTQYSGNYGTLVHVRGKQGQHGNCLHYVPPENQAPEAFKDTLMRTHVRESFVRTSTGLLDMADQERVTRRVGMRAHGPSAVTFPVVSCEHPPAQELLRQRDLLMRYLEEVLENEDLELAGTDRRWYFNRIKEMNIAIPRRGAEEDKRGSKGQSAEEEGSGQATNARCLW